MNIPGWHSLEKVSRGEMMPSLDKKVICEDDNTVSSRVSFACPSFHFSSSFLLLEHRRLQNGLLSISQLDAIVCTFNTHSTSFEKSHLQLPILIIPASIIRHTRPRTTASTSWLNRSQFPCQNNPGRYRLPQLHRQFMDNPLLPPRRLHAGLHDRAGGIREIER